MLSVQEIHNKLNKSLEFINNYNWLINSYILDFYVDNHWNKLPVLWKNTFENIKPLHLANLLNNTNTIENNSNHQHQQLYPLSILCIQSLLKEFCISRQPTHNDQRINTKLGQQQQQQNNKDIISQDNNKFMNLLFKNVKLKKRHEILKMANYCAAIATEYNVDYILDFGSGLGHLARMLTYKYKLNVCCLEQQLNLTEQAKLLDQQFELKAYKYKLLIENDYIYLRPKHLNKKLSIHTEIETFLEDIFLAFNIQSNQRNNFQFGIIGLHSCGDLAAILLEIFLHCKNAKFINIVGCCYMKLTCTDNNNNNSNMEMKLDNNNNNNQQYNFNGYPLSEFTKSNKNYHLNYEAREIACHAIENYQKRLLNVKTNDFDEYLIVHSYRATIEQILIKYWPELKHCGLKNIKHTDGLTFFKYCQNAVQHLNIQISNTDIYSIETTLNLSKWKLVVIFYTLRLMFAPLIESIILYDRLLYVREQLNEDCFTEIKAIFDPEISPRNLILTVIK